MSEKVLRHSLFILQCFIMFSAYFKDNDVKTYNAMDFLQGISFV
jgi:hypothetical protein